MSNKGFFKGEKKKQKKNPKDKNNHISNSPVYQMPEIINEKKSSEN